MTTATCTTCSAPITITNRHPHKRYCSPRCRVSDWHRHHDRPHLSTLDTQGRDVPDPVPHATAYHHAPDRVPNHDAPTGYVANGDQRCPHCHAPIAIIAVLVPPTAAHVRTPEVTTTSQ
jgi:endogenous inhibitor of DNA gyrase (YacG/DUF329 family)